MKKVVFELENCYGIPKFVEAIEFSEEKKAHLIYAPNGTMKTSFTDAIYDIQQEKTTIDVIYPERNTVRKVYECISEDNNRDMGKDDVFVIPSYVEKYKAQQMSTLLVNEALREKYDRIYDNIENKKQTFIKILENESGLKNEIDYSITNDFAFNKNQLHECFDKIDKEYNSYSDDNLAGIRYIQIFNKDTVKVFESTAFLELIEQYIDSYQKLLIDNPVFKKTFNHTSAESVLKNLDSSGFFIANHKVVLDGTTEPLDKASFKSEVEKAKKLILDSPEMANKFQNIDKLFSNAGLREFRDFLMNNNYLLLEMADLPKLKKKLWVTYITKNLDTFNELLLAYKNGKEELLAIIKQAKDESTVWNDVIREYNERFSNMPFELVVKNREDVILKNEVPTVGFTYSDRDKKREIDEDTLITRLSNGERKALYLLNIIFEIKAIQETDKNPLLVIDDIADSFDYRNKYAIIEYLKDIVDSGSFLPIILTHNFDFYRTVACRLGLKNSSHFAINIENTICLKNGEYHENVFEKWKSHVYSENKIFISAIPFIRNIVEYTDGKDNIVYKSLTNLLHYKDAGAGDIKGTEDILVSDLKQWYISIWKTDVLKFKQHDNTPVKTIIFEEANKILASNTVNPIKLENKIVLSIAIRLIAEIYMINRISATNAIQSITSNQTRELRNLIQFNHLDTADKKREEIIEKVLIITSENIHLNSFMYEPIIDIALDELKSLYREVSSL